MHYGVLQSLRYRQLIGTRSHKQPGLGGETESVPHRLGALGPQVCQDTSQTVPRKHQGCIYVPPVLQTEVSASGLGHVHPQGMKPSWVNRNGNLGTPVLVAGAAGLGHHKAESTVGAE